MSGRIGEALLISEPKIRFAVPIKVIHYPEYLDESGKVEYELPVSKSLSEIDERLRRIHQAGGSLVTKSENKP